MRVLVIDDEPDARMLCRVNLELEGHKVLEASSGHEGLQLAQKEHPDVIVLDLILPDLDGLELLTLLLRNGARRIPVIVLSADVQARHLRETLMQGAVTYLTKPFDPMEFTRLVETVGDMIPEPREIFRRGTLSGLTPVS